MVKCIESGNRAISLVRNFFELGGRSLQAILVINNIEREFGQRLPIPLFLSMPTIREIADFIQSFGEDEAEVEIVDSVEEFNF